MIKDKDTYLDKVSKLIQYAKAYYVDDKPIATDDEYDKLYHEVLDYETANPTERVPLSPTTVVGGISSKFTKAEHRYRMWSQQDIFTKDELIKWYSGILKHFKTEPELLLESKYDGLSLKLIYRNGVLEQAITRGDGRTGEDVTHNAKYVKGVPHVIDTLLPLDISGEVVMHKDDFDKLNTVRMASNQDLLANPRNAAAGTMRNIDGKVVKSRVLHFYPWSLESSKIALPTLEDRSIYLEELGFSKPIYRKVVKDFNDIIDSYNELHDMRPNLNVGIDGFMIKVNDISKHIAIGYTVKFPKWSCAYKFDAVEKSTTINNIELQVGRTGTVTPVAVLEPVDIDGSVVSKATLHNFKEIAAKDIRIGDVVTIIKSGDIIPKIINVFKDRRTDNAVKYVPPTHCPVCNTTLRQDVTQLVCDNVDCPSKIIKTITHFVSRDYMNIDGLGTKVIEQLIDNNLIRTPLDLYTLDREALRHLEGFKDKKIDNLLSSIKNSVGRTADRFLAALGIPTVGRTVSKKLLDTYGKVLGLTRAELLAVDGIGEEIVDNYLTYMKENEDYVVKLYNVTKPITPKPNKNTYTAVLTGSMVPNKGYIKELLEADGATIKSSVTSKTDLVVYGDKAGSKLDKAKELNIKILSYVDIVDELGRKDV